MANLIEQMNVLKGLSDEALNGEMGAPSGSVPPYLVLSEVQRRKDMRQRYEGAQAQRAKRTTVMEDLAGPVAMPGGSPGVPAPSGIGAAGQPEVQGFADGGIIDYADIAKKYQERLGGLSEERDRARAMALIAAGAGIMGGGHSNTLQNIGIGAQTGIASYADAIKTVDSDELALMRGLTDIGQLQTQLANAEADRGLRREEIGISRDRLNADNLPAAAREAAWYADPSTTDAEREAYDANRYNPNAVTTAERLADDLDKIYADAAKLFPIGEYDQPEEAGEKQRKAQTVAYQRIAASRGKLVADEWARNQGLALGDLVVGGAPSGTKTGDAVSYTGYFN